MNEAPEELYPCVGICMSDPDTGYCMGCGRPPLGNPNVAIEIVTPQPTGKPAPRDPDTPE